MNTSNISTHKNQISGSRLQRFRELFVSRQDAYAVWKGNQPVAVREPLSDKVLAAHLAGECRAGTYLIRLDGKTPSLVFDVDVQKKKLVRRILKRLRKRKAKAYVERSKSKGFHIWISSDDRCGQLERDSLPNFSCADWMLRKSRSFQNRTK